MKRRKFIRTGLAGAVAPVFLNGFGFKAFGASVVPAATCDFADRSLVIIYLAGANDIINTAVPMNHFGAYQNERPNIHLPQNSLITLDNGLIGTNRHLGLHPSLQSFKDLYDSDLMSIVQRTGYNVPNRSHFASEDIMLKGIDGTISNGDEEEGWVGRFLKDRYPTYKGLPFGEEVDPLGIILGDTPNTGFHTTEAHELEINLSGQDPAGFFNIISSLSGEPISQIPNSDHGELLNYISVLEKSTQVYSERISSVFDAGTNNVNTYPNSNLGNQLKTIARFISGGSKTKVFMARKGGWDNHVNMVNTNDTTTGAHANLLDDLSRSIKAFQDDLQALNKSSQVTTVVFSEFGRKIIQNGSSGTDHGTVSSMFVIGDNVNTGVYGENINITQKDNQGAPEPSQLQNDYRSVFSSILQDWMGASDDALLASFSQTPSSVVLNNIPVISAAQAVDPNCYFAPTQPVSMNINLTLLLEGFYDSANGTMSTDLVTNNLLPNRQPYGDTRYSYFGNEYAANLPSDIVDWVLIELWREDNLVIDRKAVLLRQDGRIIDPETLSDLIPIGGLYPEPFRVAVFHRSHIGVLRTATIDAQQGVDEYMDITTAMSEVSGVNQLKNINGRFALIAGDMDQNGLINSGDYSLWKRANNVTDYRTTDLNADGITDAQDYALWKDNRSKIGNPLVHNLLKR